MMVSHLIQMPFDWDHGNRAKCQKHGVRLEEIEYSFRHSGLMVAPNLSHSAEEMRYIAINRLPGGRGLFVVFTIRERQSGSYIRPISARYMHQKEWRRYEKIDPNLQNG